METLINFLMGFSTALLPAMLFIAYFLHKNGLEATLSLQEQLHQAASALNASKESALKYQQRLVNSEKNNIELTKIQESLREEVRLLNEKIQTENTHEERSVSSDENQASQVPTFSAQWDSIQEPESGPGQRLVVSSIENPSQWVREQLESVKQKLVVPKLEPQVPVPGYVYVLSNTECFGEGQLFIQATERLEPMDAVRDISSDDPKVFHFEVQLVVFNEDSKGLVRALQKQLEPVKSFSPIFNIPLFATTMADVGVALTAAQDEMKNRGDGSVPEPVSGAKVLSFSNMTVESSLKNAA